MDLKRKQFKTTFAGRPLTLEVSRLAEQATASVMGRYDETAVLVTVTMSNTDKDAGYFPLLVDYEERFYAAGKIIGSRFVRREGRPSEDAVLSGRLIDRTIRPLFDHRIRREVQVVVTVLSIDEESEPDFIALIAASTALGISKIPWDGPVAGVHLLGKSNGELVVNPNGKDRREGTAFSAFVAGTEDAVNMIELEGKEAAEESVLAAFAQAQEEIRTLVRFESDIIKTVGLPKETVPLMAPDAALAERIRAFLAPRLEAAIYQPDKKEQEAAMRALEDALRADLAGTGCGEKEWKQARVLLEEETDALVHRNVLERDRRPDGRKLDQIRELHAETGLFSRTHGSALFIRGNTQALAVTTLAAPNAEQMIETMEFSGTRRFLLHYNFPPYAVGEIGPFRGPGRREIGHGALAGKAIRNLIPPKEQFPYTIRVVSEILSSNGSSSMATVCAASLSLMDAGVPLPAAIAGIAMGLIMDNPSAGSGQERYKILTDIQGPEDHYGDMDFKAAGTARGLTAVQMDVKIKGLTLPMLKAVLAAALKARLEILATMNAALPAPRPALSPYAPIILTLAVPREKIGEVIGPGGRVINGIIERTGALSIDIEEDGRVFITAADRARAEAAFAEVNGLVKTYTVGEFVEGPVIKILDFGAIVELGPNRDGMIHVSELKSGYVKSVSDVLKVGDRVRAKVIRADPDGRIGLSLKRAEGDAGRP